MMVSKKAQSAGKRPVPARAQSVGKRPVPARAHQACSVCHGRGEITVAHQNVVVTKRCFLCAGKKAL